MAINSVDAILLEVDQLASYVSYVYAPVTKNTREMHQHPHAS